MNYGSNEHFFGLGAGHLPEKADAIAKKHGATLVNHTEPQGYKRHWFCCPNKGHPFDKATANDVMKELREAGVIA